jgi:hypothetical protein
VLKYLGPAQGFPQRLIEEQVGGPDQPGPIDVGLNSSDYPVSGMVAFV